MQAKRAASRRRAESRQPAKRAASRRRAESTGLARIDWERIEADLDARGHALAGRLLTARECASLRRCFQREASFRSTVDMEPKRFGRGRYRYFSYPLPPLVQKLRESLYPPLAAIANRWQERLGPGDAFEAELDGFLARCHAAGQTRPTPLLLRYEPGDYNRMHQDVYGRIAFPLQVALVLSRDGSDYTGGEFLVAEQRPRMQTRVSAVRLGLGEAIVFPNAVRPVRGPRGDARAQMRHGVSELLTGERLTLGIIFHDAK